MSDPLEAYGARLADSPVGPMVATISWGDRPEGEPFPALVLMVVSPGRRYDHDGFDGLQSPRVQADIWAESFAETRRIGDAYIAAIEQATLRDGVQFGAGFVDSDIDIPPISGSGRESIYRRSIDMLLTWEVL
jgi:hypothetical protein